MHNGRFIKPELFYGTVLRSENSIVQWLLGEIDTESLYELNISEENVE